MLKYVGKAMLFFGNIALPFVNLGIILPTQAPNNT
jgi:hypothetical protein